MSEKKKRARGEETAAQAPSSASGAAARPGARQGSNKARGDSPMDVGLLEQLVRLMADNDLNTVEVRDGDKRVILKRGPAVSAAPAYAYAPPIAGPQASPLQAGTGAGTGAGGAAPAADEASNLVAIKAEMVGTFYSSPKPGEPAFVNVGSTVDEETPVCVIEAMKNFFPVKAGVRGTIAKILVQNSQTVQFDQPLFLVRPS